MRLRRGIWRSIRFEKCFTFFKVYILDFGHGISDGTRLMSVNQLHASI